MFGMRRAKYVFKSYEILSEVDRMPYRRRVGATGHALEVEVEAEAGGLAILEGGAEVFDDFKIGEILLGTGRRGSRCSW